MSLPGLQSILRNTGYLVSVRGLNILVRAVYVVTLTRMLGPELYGLFAYATSWYLAFLPLTMMGLDVILGREVGRRSSDAASVVVHTLTLRIVAALAVAIMCALLGLYLEQEPLPQALLLIFSLALIGRSLALWADGVFTAYEVARESFRLHLLFRPAEVAIGIVVLLTGGGVIVLAVAHALVWWVQAAVALFKVAGLLVDRRFKLLPGAGVLSVLGAAVPLGFVALLEAWFLHGPVIIFRHTVASEADLGQLSLAMQALMLSVPLGVAVAKAGLPVVTRSVGRGDGKDRIFAEEALRLTAWLGLVAWLTGTDWGGSLVAAFFDERYAASGELLGPTLALFYPFVGSVILARVLMARQEAWLLVWISLFGAVLMTGLQPWMQQLFGLRGVILAMGMGLFGWLIALATLLHRRGGLRPVQSLAAPWMLIVLVVVLHHILVPLGLPIAFFSSLLLLAVVAWSASKRHHVGLKAFREKRS